MPRLWSGRRAPVAACSSGLQASGASECMMEFCLAGNVSFFNLFSEGNVSFCPCVRYLLKTGGQKFNPAFSIVDTVSEEGPQVAGTTFAHTVYVHYNKKTDQVLCKVRGANNKWTDVPYVNLKIEGFTNPSVSNLVALNDGGAILAVSGSYSGCVRLA